MRNATTSLSSLCCFIRFLHGTRLQNLATGTVNCAAYNFCKITKLGAYSSLRYYTMSADTVSDKKTSPKVVYKLRGRDDALLDCWSKSFEAYTGTRVQVSKGDIFKGAPSADAIVSPANSFGFMDGGIDAVYTKHFGTQMQERLQKIIREEHHGELLVGNAVIIPTVGPGYTVDTKDWSDCNEGQPIKFLISAPTMRIPQVVKDMPNAYLAFRAVILAVQKHNSTPGTEPIRSVLCPGLGTAVGKMPQERSAYQMLKAFETYELGLHNDRIQPENLEKMWEDHEDMITYPKK